MLFVLYDKVKLVWFFSILYLISIIVGINEHEVLNRKILAKDKEIGSLIMTIDTLTFFNNKKDKEIETLHQFIKFNELKSFEVKTYEATGYAPLDPNAVEGMCYSGDPSITASGRKVQPGITIAAGPDLPFGTWIWIEGYGWRRVDDRGSKVVNGKIDIAFATRKEAFEFGRRQVTVVIPTWVNSAENL